MRTLFLDCIAGMSGDMFVGALLDLGAPAESLHQELGKLGISEEFELRIARQKRQSIDGVKFDVLLAHDHSHVHSHPRVHSEGADHAHDHTHDNGHEHEHEHEHGRSFRVIRDLIHASTLSEQVKRRSVAVFQRIADAEGKVHGMSAEEVHFHEVGAVDSIVDIVSGCILLESLGVERVVSSALFEGSGWVKCAHGRFPVPTPATLEILKGIPLKQIDSPLEYITPTGAAFLAELCDTFGQMPTLRIERIGYGVGTRDPADRPNVLRAILGEADQGTESVMEFRINLDDLTPELAAAAADDLRAAGALDVLLMPATMKKGRPGFVLVALCSESMFASLSRLAFASTGTLGMRFERVSRLTLDRSFRDVQTAFGSVRIKDGSRDGQRIVSAPEFEACRELARQTGVGVRDVFLAAQAAAQQQE